MGKLLILAVLIVTIPRWAGAFMPIDKFVLWGIPVTAIGTGIIMGLGTYYVVETLQMVNRQYRESFEKWETHDRNMEAQGKMNHKPKPVPPRSRVWLASFFGLLLFLTAVSQTPYVISEFIGTPVAELMTQQWLSLYSLALVVSPEIIVAAMALATHERGALKDEKRGEDKFSLSRFGSVFLSRLAIPRLASDHEGTGDDGGSGEKDGKAKEAKQLRCFCTWNETTSPRGLSSHSRIHKEEALAFDTPTLAYRHFIETYPDAYGDDNGNRVEGYDLLAPDHETLERWFKDK